MTRCRWTCPFLLLCAASLPAAGQTPHARIDGADKIKYLDRSVLLDTLPTRSPGPTPQPYLDVVNRSLIIRNPEVVDNSDFQHNPNLDITTLNNCPPDASPGSWTFPFLLTKTLNSVGYPQPSQNSIAQWLSDLHTGQSLFPQRWLDCDSQQRLNGVPLRLLGVVNRLDLARSGTADCPANMVCRAEFRFVYAGITEQSDSVLNSPFFTLILEFVLPPLSQSDFTDLAWRWALLSQWQDTARHRSELEKLLTYSFSLWNQGPKLARIRTNSRGGNQGPWTFSQFMITSTGLSWSPLDQQFSDDTTADCITNSSPLSQYLKGPSAQSTLEQGNYNFFTPPAGCGPMSSLPTCQGTVNFDSTLVTLDKRFARTLQPRADDLRHAISINSCTACHGQETQGAGGGTEFTHFDQLKYRERNTPSKLSNFLTGGTDGEPVLDAVTVQPPLLQACGTTAGSRSYNDILRRFLFQFFLLNPFPIVLPGPPGSITVLPVHINDAHLAARQVH